MVGNLKSRGGVRIKGISEQNFVQDQACPIKTSPLTIWLFGSVSVTLDVTESSMSYVTTNPHP